ncbi:transcription factor SPT20 homolog [Drosophila nasuta]|uniref:transcription factor SPT20 homolog n=1 Tax=Drosophila nasuta TaxID=42062 RepID=UPI00295E413C|nr:transcription factor SPT20 homolog [Drosophila nasuta]
MNLSVALLALVAVCCSCGPATADISLKQSPRFEESSYGNSRYQIFEHDFQRKQPLRLQPAVSYRAAGYLPPTVATPSAQQQQQIYQTAVSSSLSSTAPQQFTQQAQSYQAPGYLPPTGSNIEQQQQQVQQQQVHVQHQQQQLQLQQQQQQQQLISKPTYRGNDYLPPTTSSTTTATSATATAAAIPSYAQQQQSQVYRAPPYLPPQQQQRQQRQQPQHCQRQQQLKSQPQQVQQQQQQVQATATATATEYQAPGYLPPGYEFANPDQLPLAPVQTVAAVQQQPAVGEYRAPDYLPPSYDEVKQQPQPQPQQQQQPQIVYQQQPQQVQQQQVAVQQQQVQVQQQQQVQVQQQQVQVQQQQVQVQQQHVPTQQQQVQLVQQQPQITHPGALPEGYEFTKPENFEAAIAELHSLQTQTKLLKQQQQQQQLQLQQQQLQLQQQQQQQQRQQQQQPRHVGAVQGSNIIYGAPKQQQQPTTATLTTAAPVARPIAVAAPAPVAAPLPAPPTTQHTHIHTLRSYMNTVQPLARYGQPQPQQQPRVVAQQQQPQIIEVAPMYREQSKRPRFYAPAMSYARNALPTQYHQHHHIHHVQQQQQQQHRQVQQQRATLNFQAQQSLQKFMPREMQMAVNVAVAAAANVPRGSSRVRTVQIVKPHAVRTFKVLETLDAAGVKTIKILGTSNEQPRGQHHIVKVVTQDAHNGVENHVQTVKIYDDQQEYVPPQQQPQQPQQPQQQQAQSTTRGYLPPTAARPRTRIVREASKVRTLRLLPVARH